MSRKSHQAVLTLVPHLNRNGSRQQSIQIVSLIKIVTERKHRAFIGHQEIIMPVVVANRPALTAVRFLEEQTTIIRTMTEDINHHTSERRNQSQYMGTTMEITCME